MTNNSLIQKYNVPAPRYTSYPPVPHWNNNINRKNWAHSFSSAYEHFGPEEGITLYIHLPFCESLCTYCGCNKRITKKHNVELPYISAVMKEWEMYVELLGEKPKLAEIHLGGGTPTFFSPDSLSILINFIFKTSRKSDEFEFSFEGHPNNTTKEHLHTLAGLGFNRVSFGIQDFDKEVQLALHRIQPFEKVKYVTEESRKAGFTSINFDLIFGLPHQTLDTLKATFDKTRELLPERIAFYSYATFLQHFLLKNPSKSAYQMKLKKESFTIREKPGSMKWAMKKLEWIILPWKVIPCF